MKKNILYFLLACLQSINMQPTHLGLFSAPKASNAPQLSISQLFQLNILQESLNLYAPLIIRQGIHNQNTQILFQQTDLAVQQSSPETSGLMKARIIELFANFKISVTFNPENIISLRNNTHDIPSKEDTFKPTKRPTLHKKKQPYHFFSIYKHSDKPSSPKPLPRIHGARRTMRRLKKKRELQEKIAKQRIAFEETIQRQKIEAQRNTEQNNKINSRKEETKDPIYENNSELRFTPTI